MSSRIGVPNAIHTVVHAFIAAVGRLDKSLKPLDTFQRLSNHTFTYQDSIYIFHFVHASFWLYLMQAPAFLKLLIPVLYITAIIIPFTSQFFLPAAPVLSWVVAFFNSKFIPGPYRPNISVSLLPTLESVLYGANISDLLTRVTHPILDIISWLPYGVFHFVFPIIVAGLMWLFRPKAALPFWARAFGYMSLTGVWVQTVFPCAAPWYELIYGLTPATYAIPGDAGGLRRIDALFGTQGYEKTFAKSPIVFGAFPSLHAGWATLEVLFISQFFPEYSAYAWAYASVLYWATMYLTHHYLIDVVGGACLAIACFYLFLPDEFRGSLAVAPAGTTLASLGLMAGNGGAGAGWNKYEVYDLEAPRRGHSRGQSSRMMGPEGVTEGDFELSESDDEEEDITFRSPVPGSTFNLPTVSQAPAVEAAKKSHRHTASIGTIRGDGRGEEGGWSPIKTGFA